MKILLEDVYKKIVSFLNKEKVEYIIIGGIAAGILGEPRSTCDVDIDILLPRDKIGGFIKKLKEDGFKIEEQKCLKRAAEIGVFQIGYGGFHIDFIIASIELEKEAFRRSKIVELYGLKAFFPSVEDFILLKIVPGRGQDIVDIEKAILRHRDKLDTKYLLGWAQKLSDEAQDMRIYNDIKTLIAVK